jgi:hypothetical protein
MSHRFALLLAALAVVAAPQARATTAPPTGVYGCYDVRFDYQMRMVITVMPFVMFGLIDAATYSDYDGHHGAYAYDGATGILTMTDGPREGWRYQKTGDWSFTLIDNKTGKPIYTCPLDAGKDPTKGPW